MSYIIDATIGTSLTLTTGELSAGGQGPLFAVGTRRVANDGVYQYVHANGAIAQYAMVKIDDDFEAAEGTTTLLPNTEPAKVGIAQVAFADNDYGWVFVGPGLATCKVAALCAQDVKLYTTATPGVVDDASTTLINGLKLITTVVGASSVPVEAACELGTVLA